MSILHWAWSLVFPTIVLIGLCSGITTKILITLSLFRPYRHMPFPKSSFHSVDFQSLFRPKKFDLMDSVRRTHTVFRAALP